VPQVLVIAAALSVQDPRERPPGSQGRADEAHRRFAGDDSDFGFFLNLLRIYEEECGALSRSKRKHWCEKHFLSYSRMLEWFDIHGQLVELARELGLAEDARAAGGDDSAVHRALLTGLFRNVAMRFDDKTYVGARNVKMQLFPGSVLFKKRPQWIMAAEIIETERLYARIAAKIDPDWIEPLAEHLVAKSYSEPHWDARRGQVVGYEKVTLYGLPLVTQRRVDWSRIDSKSAREIFIRSALVEGQLGGRAPFLEHNRALLDRVASLSDKLRSRDLGVNDEAVYGFFDARVPASVANGATFERWRKDAERQLPELLHLRLEDVLTDRARAVSEADYPSVLSVAGHAVPLRYRFEPGHPEDGVTAVLSLPIVHRLPEVAFEWLVPGLLQEKVHALLESLPKVIRRELSTGRPGGTLAEIATRCREHACCGVPGEGSLRLAVVEALAALGGPKIDPSAFRLDMLPPHLLMRFEVLDEDSREVAASRDLVNIQAQLLARAAKAFARIPKGAIERSEVTRWDFGDLPDQVEVPYGSGTIPGYPALAALPDARVSVVVTDTPARAESMHREGVRALLALALSDVTKQVRRTLVGIQAACLQYARLGTCDELRHAIVLAAIERVCRLGERSIRGEAEFNRAVSEARGRVGPASDEIASKVSEALVAYQRIEDQLARGARDQGSFAVLQIRAHLERLIYPGFVRDTPWSALEQLPRYLRAVELRLTKMRENPAKHQARAAVIEPFFAQYDERVARAEAEGRRDRALETYRWLLEEFHLFTFAEELKPAKPVSQKRLAEAWSALG
jgi:ATP-dependent helicase HrpA